jgi:sigma-E factor negative regulatory protein RseB
MRVLAVLLLSLCGAAQAQAPAQAHAHDAAGWLKRVYAATQKLSYSGTFVYRQGDRSESSRVTRLVDASGDTEKLESLDGEPREIVRKGDEVKCYLPDSMTVKVDRRTDRRSFPSLLPAQVSGLAENYTLSKAETARIAGYDCQAIVLTPKDELRYGYKLWVDVATAMPLKARIFNEKGEAVEEFTFTQLTIGGQIDREKLKPKRYAKAKEWRVEDAAVAPVNVAEAGWTLKPDLPGFHKVVEVRRKLRESRPVSQIVYSDGLAAVSVFIESMEGRSEPVRAGMSSMGAINIYTREVANHVVTVVGEAPAASVRRIGNTVEYRRPQ